MVLSQFVLLSILLEENIPSNITIVRVGDWIAVTDTTQEKRVIFTIDEEFYDYIYYRGITGYSNDEPIYEYEIESLVGNRPIRKVNMISVEVDEYIPIG